MEKCKPENLVKNGQTVTNPNRIAEMFNEYFVKIGKNVQDKIPPLPSDIELTQYSFNNSNKSFFLTPVTADEIRLVITSFNCKNAKREIDVDTRFIKYSNVIIPPFLCNIFNCCVNQGTYPNSLKIVKVVPVYKRGNKGNCSNYRYRPISLLSQFNKIFEKLLASKIYN